MRKEVKVLGLSYSQSQVGSYVVVLSERKGKRKLPIVIKASDVPSQPLPIVTSYDLTVYPTKVKISWIAPYNNNETILEYHILILEQDNVTYSEDTVDCNG